MPGPNAAMQLSDAGLEALAHDEGFVGHVYLCPAGVPTYGYGHVVRPGDTRTTITEPEARELLRLDAETACRHVRALVRVPLTQSQFDALVSLVFNIGGGAFASSTLLRLLNAGDYAGAEAQFHVWRIGGGKVLPVLVARRAREAKRFHGEDGLGVA